jgi:hypothetical protein
VMLARLWQGGGRGKGSRAREAVEGIEVGRESRGMRGLLSAGFADGHRGMSIDVHRLSNT